MRGRRESCWQDTALELIETGLTFNMEFDSLKICTWNHQNFDFAKNSSLMSERNTWESVMKVRVRLAILFLLLSTCSSSEAVYNPSTLNHWHTLPRLSDQKYCISIATGLWKAQPLAAATPQPQARFLLSACLLPPAVFYIWLPLLA